ncbi:hypothetical protein [Longimicrobium sp.]|uniref:hypothetical protein n=1 Tax=Longimicrobium sp. TaxID=2029185 RepID=UPI002E32E1A6|nr:hypothetical protein [Longimicrobium sp.]HEX6037842.1 hypothetical protein [Longimicrobium sp.]
METPQRRLVTIRRHVPQDRLSDYAEGWTRLHNAVTARGAHAWWFASASQPDVYIEFLEFGPETDPRGDEAVVNAIRALQLQFNEMYPTPLTLEEWVAMPTPPTLSGDPE